MKFVRAKKDDSFFKALEKGHKHWAYEAEGLKLEVADLIDVLMKEQGINRSTLAEKVGVSPAYITKALHGYANLTLNTLAKFGYALDHRFRMIKVPLECDSNIYTVLQFNHSPLSTNIVEDPEKYDHSSEKTLVSGGNYDLPIACGFGG